MNNSKFPQVAVGGVVFHDNKVLLVKRKNRPSQGKWAVPGGKVLPGETMQQALVREVAEETGINIKVQQVCYVFDVIEKNKDDKLQFHYIIIDFLCEYMDGKPIAGDDATETGWFSEEQISQIDVNEKTRSLLKKKYNFG